MAVYGKEPRFLIQNLPIPQFSLLAHNFCGARKGLFISNSVDLRRIDRWIKMILLFMPFCEATSGFEKLLTPNKNLLLPFTKIGDVSTVFSTSVVGRSVPRGEGGAAGEGIF